MANGGNILNRSVWTFYPQPQSGAAPLPGESEGILVRCSNYLHWLLSIKRSSRSHPDSRLTQIPITWQRNFIQISTTCTCNLIALVTTHKLWPYICKLRDWAPAPASSTTTFFHHSWKGQQDTYISPPQPRSIPLRTLFLNRTMGSALEAQQLHAKHFQRMAPLQSWYLDNGNNKQFWITAKNEDKNEATTDIPHVPAVSPTTYV